MNPATILPNVTRHKDSTSAPTFLCSEAPIQDGVVPNESSRRHGEFIFKLFDGNTIAMAIDSVSSRDQFGRGPEMHRATFCAVMLQTPDGKQIPFGTQRIVHPTDWNAAMHNPSTRAYSRKKFAADGLDWCVTDMLRQIGTALGYTDVGMPNSVAWKATKASIRAALEPEKAALILQSASTLMTRQEQKLADQYGRAAATVNGLAAALANYGIDNIPIVAVPTGPMSRIPGSPGALNNVPGPVISLGSNRGKNKTKQSATTATAPKASTAAPPPMASTMNQPTASTGSWQPQPVNGKIPAVQQLLAIMIACIENAGRPMTINDLYKQCSVAGKNRKAWKFSYDIPTHEVRQAANYGEKHGLLLRSGGNGLPLMFTTPSVATKQQQQQQMQSAPAGA